MKLSKVGRRASRHGFVIGALVLAGASACSCQSPQQPPPDGFVRATIPAASGGSLASADGKLTLLVRPRSLAADTEIGVRLVPAEELPEAVKALGPAGAVYELSPSGLEFEIPAALLWDVGESTAPAPQLFTFSEQRGVEPLFPPGRELDRLPAPPAAREGGAVVAELSHFSMIFERNGGLTTALEKAPAKVAVKTVFTQTFTVSVSSGVEVVGSPKIYSVSGGTVVRIRDRLLPGSGGLSVLEASFECGAVGLGSYGGYAELAVRVPDGAPVVGVTEQGYEVIQMGDSTVLRKPAGFLGYIVSRIQHDVECVGEPVEEEPIPCCCSWGCDSATLSTCLYDGCAPMSACDSSSCPGSRTEHGGACCYPDGACVITQARSCTGQYLPLAGCGGECPQPVYDPLTGVAMRMSELMDYDVDDGRCTDLSDGKRCERPQPEQRIEGVLDPIVRLSSAAATRVLGGAYACSGGTFGKTLCAPNASAAAGDYVMLVAQFGADVPLAGSRFLQYAFVFDSDGDTGNNWEPLAAYPKDFFQGADLWYEATFAPSTGWAMKVRDVRQGLAEVPSGARIVFRGRQMAILIPRSELDIDRPGFRVTAFAHDGDYGLRGGAYSADYFPGLDSSLQPIADSLFTVEE